MGGFFVISGYVSAYTTTKLGASGVEEKKVANADMLRSGGGWTSVKNLS